MATGCGNTSTGSNSSSTYRLLKQQQQQLHQQQQIYNLVTTDNLIKQLNATELPDFNSSNCLFSSKLTNNNKSNINEFNFKQHQSQPKQWHKNSSNFSLKNSVFSHVNTNANNLKIKTKSIESTLLPLVNQISTLVNFKENIKTLSSPSAASTPSGTYYSERTANALLRVGEAVNLAVERFVSVGESIAHENPVIKFDMLDACKEAREAGFTIKAHTQTPNSIVNVISSIKSNGMGGFYSNMEKTNLIQAANTLLDSVTRVLLLADVVIINQILDSKNKVLQTLNKLEGVLDFWNFVQLFTQYGADLIELAHSTGERQNDLKDDKQRSQLSSARWTLEKSTVMILSSSKAYLKHLECECAKENITLVYTFLQQALENLHSVIVDSGSVFDFPFSNANNTKSSLGQIWFINAYRQFEDALDLARNNMIMDNGNFQILNSLSILIESTQDFTDSLFINNDQRERIIRLQNEIKEQTLIYLKEEERAKEQEKNIINDGNNNNKASNGNSSNSNSIGVSTRFTRLFKTSPILNDCEVLKKLLQSQTMQLANCLFRDNQDATLLNLIKNYSLSNQYDLLIETLDKFKDYSDHVLEICKLLRHISTLDVFEVTCEHHFNVFDNLSKMIQSAASTTALYPECKSTNENLNLFCDSWENQVNDLSVLVKEMQELINGAKTSKTVYFSLPRPGKHGTSARISSSAKPSKLDSMEQAKIAKLGLEMKLITSEIEAEADKWNEPQNEIVKLAKLMSDMAYEIHLFTRGEGSLKTTQDLFNKAESFLQLGVLLYGIVKDFLVQVPNGFLKEELINLLEKLPLNFRQLKNRLKQTTIGKTATFNKVDCVIQETRDFMNLVAKMVTSCFLCTTKYNIINLDNQFENLNLNTTETTTKLNQNSINTYNYNGFNSLSHLENYLIGDQTKTSNMTSYNPNNFHTLNFSVGNSNGYTVSNSNRSDSCEPGYRAHSLNRL